MGQVHELRLAARMLTAPRSVFRLEAFFSQPKVRKEEAAGS